MNEVENNPEEIKVLLKLLAEAPYMLSTVT